eukprot:30936-Pelagococcus_subviridis.AAC.2
MMLRLVTSPGPSARAIPAASRTVLSRRFSSPAAARATANPLDPPAPPPPSLYHPRPPSGSTTPRSSRPRTATRTRASPRAPSP